jgi:hypothetical protein
VAVGICRDTASRDYFENGHVHPDIWRVAHDLHLYIVTHENTPFLNKKQLFFTHSPRTLNQLCAGLGCHLIACETSVPPSRRRAAAATAEQCNIICALFHPGGVFGYWRNSHLPVVAKPPAPALLVWYVLPLSTLCSLCMTAAIA